MSRWFSNLSIRSKLLVLMAASTTLALALAASAFGAYEVFTFRRTLAQKVTTVADIVGQSCAAALQSGDRKAGRDLLAALEAEPSIEGGAVFDAAGAVFAAYGVGSEGAFPPGRPGEIPSGFAGQHVAVVRPIVVDGERIGTVYIRASLDELTARLLLFVVVTLGIVTVAGVVALLVSARLQHRISQPILDLARTARRVSSERNFSLRAAPGGGDELGALVEDFNRMLGEIARQDQQLREQQEHLTVEVASRTADLVAANQQLTTSMQRVERYADQIAQLTTLGQLLQSCVTAEEVFGVSQQAMERLFPYGSGALAVLQASGSLMETTVVWGSAPPRLRVYGADECWAYRRGRPHIVSDRHSPLRCAHLAGEDGAVTFCIPMLAQGDTVGVLQLSFETGDEPDVDQATGAIHSPRARLAVALAEQIALALANLRLREALRNQSIVDPLTGLFNRRYLEETLERECRRAVRMNRPLAVMMLDIDHFKQFNDTWGHDGGDAVLREMATLVHALFRGDDIACRYGGEEFVLVLAEATLAAAHTRAEQLRQAVQGLALYHREQPLGHITISIGIAALPEQGVAPDHLIAAADRALYEAKTAGSNRTVVAAPARRSLVTANGAD